MMQCPYGFRIVGTPAEERRLVDAAAALAGYAACDELAKVNREEYLSAFTFGLDFRLQLQQTRSTKGFDGACGAAYVWWDIDREGDLGVARTDVCRLIQSMSSRLGVGEDEVLVFYSGSKGFHVGLPTELWAPEPSATFNLATRRFAVAAAQAAGVEVDTSIYDKVRALRAPNSLHPKTRRHKRHLTVDEVTHLKLERIVELSREPAAFELPAPRGRNEPLAARWAEAAEAARRAVEAPKRRVLRPGGPPQLNAATMEFIRDGAAPGDRHRLLFSAAADLAGHGCPPDLAQALLWAAALDSGLLAAQGDHPADRMWPGPRAAGR
jgi:hypothetical protein